MSLALTFPGSSSLRTRDTSPFLQASNSSRKAPLTALRGPPGPPPTAPLSGLSAGLDDEELELLPELGAGAGGRDDTLGDNMAAASPGGGERGLGRKAGTGAASPSGCESGPWRWEDGGISGLRGGD